MSTYRILVVDDNSMEIDCVRFLINKFDLPLEVHTTLNSPTALRMLQSEPYDILLTDIKMPIMDGLELSRSARALSSDIIIVLFSGYSEFEYAHSAISLGIQDYLLKPIDPQNLLETLNRVIQKLQQNRLSHQQSEHLRSHLLFTLLNGGNIKRGQAFLFSYTSMVVLSFDRDYLSGEAEHFVNELRQHLNYSFDFVSIYPNQGVAFFYGTLPQTEILMRDMAEAIHSLCPCSCTLSNAQLSGLENIYTCYQTLGTDTEDEAISSHQTSDILEAVRLGNWSPFWEYYSLYRSQIASDSFERYNFARLLCVLAGQMSSSFSERDIVSSLFEVQSPEEIDRIIADYLGQESIIESQVSDTRVDSIKRYVAAHYTSDISVNEIAAVYHFSPSYLSRIFKQHTGITLVQYIHDLRMSKAVHLLENTQMKVSQIAQAVGYRSASYFCMRFRDCFGISPDVHRQQSTAQR